MESKEVKKEIEFVELKVTISKGMFDYMVKEHEIYMKMTDTKVSFDEFFELSYESMIMWYERQLKNSKQKKDAVLDSLEQIYQ